MNKSCESGFCGSCKTKLEHSRDGTEENGHRCHNCYWEEEGSRMRYKDIPPLIFPDYRINRLKEKND
jgi:hypothetical protein